jgi:hypothetical protein
MAKDAPNRAWFEETRLYFSRTSLAVGNARRTVRWLASLGVILALKKHLETNQCPWPEHRLAWVVSQLAMLW